ncbi:MAG: hypothetical protein JNJ54_07720 [Myxococcaceae bacterium]|nr:hypothetical protein [Myxococcaceae bacterium]
MRALLLVVVLAAPLTTAARKPPPEIQRIIEKDRRDESLTDDEQKKLQAWEDEVEKEEERAMEAMERNLLEAVKQTAPPEVLQELKFQCPAKQPVLAVKAPSAAEWATLIDQVSKAMSAKLGEAGPRLVKATRAKKAHDARTVGAVLGSLHSVTAGVLVTAEACRLEPSNVHCAANLGSLLDGLDDDPGAVTALAWAQAKDPKHPLPQMNLGWLSFHRGDFAAAKGRFETVERTLGPSRFTDLALGLTAHCTGDHTTARTRLRRNRLPPHARPAMDEEDQRSVQRRGKDKKSESDDGEDDDSPEPDPNEPPPSPLARSAAMRPELPHPLIATSEEELGPSAKRKLDIMKEWLEDKQKLEQRAAGLRATVAAEDEAAGTRAEGNRLVLTVSDDGADDAYERVRDYYRARFWKITKARNAALEPVRLDAKTRTDALRKRMGGCMQSANKSCAVAVCADAKGLRGSILTSAVMAWQPHHTQLHTLIGDFGQVSAEAVALARTEARRAVVDSWRQAQVINWLHADWSSAVTVEGIAASAIVELCPKEVPVPAPTSKKVPQKPAKKGCSQASQDTQAGLDLEVVAVKAGCGKVELTVNFKGFTGSIGHDKNSQTTTLFLGVGHSGELSGNAGMYFESTGGHISDFGVRATAGASAVGLTAETQLGFGVGKAVDGFLAASEGGASTGGALEAALVSGSTFQTSGGASVGPLSLTGPMLK